MVRTQVLLRPEQHRALKEMGHRKGISMAEVLRILVDEALHEEESPSRGEDPLGVAGKYSSGRRDISVRHDEYLEADFRK
ncbi:MAG: CopG family transcriptional regulator [Acidobacteriota bacterium]